MIDSIGLFAIAAVRRVVSCAIFLAFAILPAACSSLELTQPWVTPGAHSVDHLPGWPDETAHGLRHALNAQCREARLQYPWPPLCRDLSRLPYQSVTLMPSDADWTLKHWVAKRFDAWAITTQVGAARGLLTGYYEPVITGSRQRLSNSQVAIYAPPSDLVKGRPYLSRAQIEDGEAAAGLAGRTLLWVDDPIEHFFLQIQGSGRIRLRDGSVQRIGFAAHNAHQYHAIGRDLIKWREISAANMSADAIKAWLRANPERGHELMRSNPRYIFFRNLKKRPRDSGPPGSLRVPLTTMRSVATDRKFLPGGALLYLDSQLPVTDNNRTSRVGLALSQDTGGAIKGQIRADIFTGTGVAAGKLAGRIKQPMRVWLLWPKGSQPPASLPLARSATEN